ncbi:hypothetical protein, partial [Klebsiella variicola]|uniref:hypothetical protein n=1 Tax=Klebsiella variicola TaxID=244366 RepID=UPI003F6886B6
MSVLRVIALAMALAGLVAITSGGASIAPGARLPGTLLALAGAFAFALGAVVGKRWPLTLPPLTSAAWQIGIGCFP